MLAVMTYNTGVFVTISLGISIGYLFTPTLHNDPLPPSKPEEVQAYEFR
jgi:Ctr copper transporter family